MACVTADEVRQIVNVSAERGWTNAVVEQRISWAENIIASRLAPRFGFTTITGLYDLGASAPVLLKQLVLWTVAAMVYREVKGYRVEEGEANPAAVWANEADKLITTLLAGNMPLVATDGTEYAATSTVIHHNEKDRSILGGVEGVYPAVMKDDEIAASEGES